MTQSTRRDSDHLCDGNSGRCARGLWLAVLVVLAGLLAGGGGVVWADQILQTNSDSLTTYKPSGATAVQNVRPQARQRGVNLDGSMRAGGGFAWSLAGNPYERGGGGEYVAGIRGSLGTYSPTEVDLTLPALVPWVVGRTYNARQELSGAHHDSNGYQGRNWFQISQPEIALYDADGNSGTRQAADLVYLVYGADRYIEFKRTAADVDTFRGVNGAAGVFQYVAGAPDTYVYTDQVGNRTYFFGGNTSGGVAAWQVWKFVDPAGNTAYVGDATTASTAITNGYNADGAILKAYDSSGRRYCYSYSGTTIGGAKRLTQVIAETDAGGGWGDCGSETLVGKVDYSYYDTGSSSNGNDGTLKFVTITTPSSVDPSEAPAQMFPLIRRQYYRYYVGAFNSSTNTGHAYAIKMMLGHEGVRRFDWDSDCDLDNNDVDSATEVALQPFADVYLKYDADHRVASGFFDGECGCSGSIDGEHLFTYENNPGFTGTSGYDTTWEHRVVAQPPSGGAWMTQYYDEVGQPLSRVLTDISPASTGSAPQTWVTRVVRNSDGQVTQVHTPANSTGYTHNTGGNPSGAITSSTSAGLVHYYERATSGDIIGFVTGMRQREGESSLSTTSTYVTWTKYATRSLNIATGVNVTRPVAEETRAFHTATTDHTASANYDTTTMSYVWWDNTTSTNVEYVTLKKITTTAPAVSTSKNGPGSSTTSSRYLRKDGTTAYTESARGLFMYTSHTNGQVTQSIEDVKTNDTLHIVAGDDPDGTWGITESGSGEHRRTTYTYDLQGRIDETSLPSGRVTKKVYSRLNSQRPIVFSIPRLASYHGPAGYTVLNQAGNIEECYVVDIIDPEPYPGIWVKVHLTPCPEDDSVQSFNTGSSQRRLARLTLSLYGSTGRRLNSRGVCHVMPTTSEDGRSTQDTDFWDIKYDDLGRQIRVKDPTGTITRTVYDVLGRVTSRQTGTNDADESGTDDMVTTEVMVYDGGSDDGNSHLTSQTSYVVDGTGDQRVTNYIYDYRGRLLVTNGAAAPHSVTKYDNRGRVIAAGMYTTTQSAGTDPASTTTNRVALSQSFYDERGQVYKAQRHKINQSTGADEDSLQTLNWYDPDGRLIKSDGELLTKTRYDRLGRVFQSFVLANDNDAANTYADVYDATKKWASVAGDKVLEEHQTAYDKPDTVLMQATISRKHDDTTTTGPLDLTHDGGDNDPLKYTDTDVKGRIQISAMWYDELDRPITTAFYGTNSAAGNVATFDRAALTTPPSASPTGPIVSTTTYNGDGTVLETSDPKDTVTRFLYDDAGRLTATIANYTGGSTSTAVRENDLYTRYIYDKQLQTEMWVDIDGDNIKDSEDQATTYVYGTTKGTSGSGSPVQSAIGSGHLLREVIYPAQTGGQPAADRTVTYAYNAQGEQVWMRDQKGNVIETNLDTLGRETDRRVTTLDADFDGTIRRISTAYLTRGLVDTVTQYDNAAVGSGTAKDQVQYTYDAWGNLTVFKQDVDSLITGGSGRAAFQVDYVYAKNTTGRNTIRRSTMNLPGATAVTFDYLSTSGKLDADSSRVSRVNTSINLGASTTVAKYEYLGSAQVVGTDLPQPQARWHFYEGGGAGSEYPDLDRYNRVEDSRWTGYKTSGSRDFYNVDITYDEASNITSIVDNVMKAGVAGNNNFDAQYTLDALYRLKQAKEGYLNTSTWTFTSVSRDERWLTGSNVLALTQTGNWLNRRVDLNGDGDFTDAGESDETNTFNLPNELLTRDTDSNGTANFTLAYDKNGNLTDDGDDYTYVYDAFGRVKQVKNRIGGAVVAEYAYNGLGFRIGWHYDTEPDGDVDGNDPWFWFCYDESWRQVATFRSTDSNPKEIFVHHLAGLGGYGGSSYIDSVIFRDRDANTAWKSAADSTREERRYYCQNWRADVSAILTSDGKMVEWVKYSAYGIPTALPAGDTDSDGDWDATDSSNITFASTYNVRLDANLDGTVSAADITHANSITGGYQTLGRGKLSAGGIGGGSSNRRGYAGYEYDPTFNGATRHIYHVRHRVYDAEVGRWTRRDPLGYVDGMGLYEYVQSMPTILTDEMGLASGACDPNACVAMEAVGDDPYWNPDRPVGPPPPDGWNVACQDARQLWSQAVTAKLAALAAMSASCTGGALTGANPVALAACRAAYLAYIAAAQYESLMWIAYQRCLSTTPPARPTIPYPATPRQCTPTPPLGPGRGPGNGPNGKPYTIMDWSSCITGCGHWARTEHAKCKKNCPAKNYGVHSARCHRLVDGDLTACRRACDRFWQKPIRVPLWPWPIQPLPSAPARPYPNGVPISPDYVMGVPETSESRASDLYKA